MVFTSHQNTFTTAAVADETTSCKSGKTQSNRLSLITAHCQLCFVGAKQHICADKIISNKPNGFVIKFMTNSVTFSSQGALVTCFCLESGCKLQSQ